MVLIKKRFLGKATGHNDHYVINTGGKRPKIGSNWPLAVAYLQCCKYSGDLFYGLDTANTKYQIT